MEYQKIENLLDDTTNKSTSKFKIRDWDEINEESQGRYDNSNIRFKTTTIRSSLCDYSGAYILFKGTLIVSYTAATGAALNNINKKVMFKNCAPDCITEINISQVDDTQQIDVVMLMYNLIEYSDAYSKTSGSLWQYYRDEPALDDNDNIIDFHTGNNSA